MPLLLWARRNQAGTVTAEFATVVPAVLLVLACCLGGVQLAGQHLRLQDAAADAARIVSRGEGLTNAQRHVAQLIPGATASREDRDGMACIRLEVPAAVAGGLLGAVTVTASSCAMAEDT